MERPVPCTALAWHPCSKVIAAGWEDGAVTFTGPAATSRDDREVHRESRREEVLKEVYDLLCSKSHMLLQYLFIDDLF